MTPQAVTDDVASSYGLLTGKWIHLLAFVVVIHALSTVATKLRHDHTAFDVSRRHGCELPPQLTKRWPLGIDRIKQIWDANADGRLLDFFCSVAREYEPRNTITQYLLVGPRAFHVMEAKNVEAVLSTHFKDFGFGSRPAVFAPLLGNGIFTQEGASWKRSRDLLRKQFSRAQYQKLEHAFREHVDNLIQALPSRGVVDLQPLFFALTLDTATALLFGESVYSLRADIDQHVKNREFSESFNVAQDGLAKRFRLTPFHWLYNPPAFRRACRTVHQFVEDYVKNRGLARESKNDASTSKQTSSFVEQLAVESETDADLRDQLLNVLLAGRDTTACCLSWCMRLLVRHPAVLAKLRNEVLSIMGSSPEPTREQVRKMPYLACVIKETLRLYPSVPLNIREAAQTTFLPTGGGLDGSSPILVKKGEVVVFSQYIQSRKESIFGPDAAEFRPERWEGEELHGIGWSYFPFNGGPRKCLGEDFALMEVSYTIVRLLQEYSTVELPPGDTVEPVGKERQSLTLVLSSADGCRVALR